MESTVALSRNTHLGNVFFVCLTALLLVYLRAQYINPDENYNALSLLYYAGALLS